jgi:hypothetical protein
MLNSEQSLATDSMHLAANAFGPPAAKPFPLWAIVSCVVALGLATDFVHTLLQRPAPMAQEAGNRPKLGEQNSHVGATPPNLGTAGIFEHQSLPLQNAVAPTEKPVIAGPRSKHASECATLDQEVRSLGAAARVLLTPQQQDTIRASQANARSRQLALEC